MVNRRRAPARVRAWLWLAPAAATEVGWVTGLDAAATPWQWTATLVCAIASIAFALRAARVLPTTTVYILFVGLGAGGTLLVDIFVFGTRLHAATIGFFILLLAGIIGLRLTERH